MNLEIIETPQLFSLYGKSGQVQQNCFGEIGLKLMDEMWREIKQRGIATTGINHWVYLSSSRMFVGVELHAHGEPPDGLERLEFELPRYLRHVHAGPYQSLPEKWAALKNEIARRGESIGPYALEVYGHHCGDPAKLETTILIGLEQKTAGQP